MQFCSSNKEAKDKDIWAYQNYVTLILTNISRAFFGVAIKNTREAISINTSFAVIYLNIYKSILMYNNRTYQRGLLSRRVRISKKVLVTFINYIDNILIFSKYIEMSLGVF